MRWNYPLLAVPINMTNK